MRPTVATRSNVRASPSRSAANASRSSCPPAGCVRRTDVRGAGRQKRASRKGGTGAAAVDGDVWSADAGTVVTLAVEEGATLAEGDTVVIIEAMKMEQPLSAHKAGVVTGLKITAGETVGNGAVICEIKDA